MPPADPYAPADAPVGVLFVCLGNICRSPLAEGVFRHLAHERGVDHRFRIDSAGTGAWHVGQPPDPRSVDVARRHGVTLDGQRARQVRDDDCADFHYLVAMDNDNLRTLERLRDDWADAGSLALLRAWDPEPGDGEVPDPYYGGPGGFDEVFRMIRRSAEGLLEDMLSE